jgi:hypothetical protein
VIHSSFFLSSIFHPGLSAGGGVGRETGMASRRPAWSDLRERSKEMEHSSGNAGASKKLGLASMRSMINGWSEPHVHVMVPSGPRETRLLSSIHSSRVLAQGEGWRLPGDQSMECVLKLLQIKVAASHSIVVWVRA